MGTVVVVSEPTMQWLGTVKVAKTLYFCLATGCPWWGVLGDILNGSTKACDQVIICY